MNYFLIYTGYVLILSLLMGVSSWRLYKIMGYHPLISCIPFYNYYIIQKETQHPKWWVILAYLPVVGPIMLSVFHLYLMKKFGKEGLKDQILTVLLPFIYIGIVNYSKNKILQESPSDEDIFSENSTKKDSFAGSLTFAVVFATVIHVFVAQPFGIPTGSMENTMLVGDFLFVNKWSYGYRLPMRPLSIPFLQGTIMDTGKKGNPKDDPKSYIESVKLPYERIFQFQKPKRNELAVINYPRDSVHKAIDRMDPYVKRNVAVAGDIFEIRNGKFFINGKSEHTIGDQFLQHSFTVRTSAPMNISSLYKAYGYLPLNEVQTNSGFTYTFQGLTEKVASDLRKDDNIQSILQNSWPKDSAAVAYQLNADHSAYTKSIDTSQSIFPINKKWNPHWYGPVRIPKKNDIVTLNQESLPMYEWIIKEYEHNSLERKNGKIFINGKETTRYTIQQDYYMMIGDNRDASLDGRFFGFVPEENIIGKPILTWLSIQGLFKNDSSTYQAPLKIRWDRMFKLANTGETNKTSYWWVGVIILVVLFGWENIIRLIKKIRS
ncbi:signal peptidase I [Chryseobacterium sp. Mn2064]|uniref:signal peptidase I n=1 Tax=Chryseobacterium sp. Mn2064 TaxID=3395263 RepID=UPI003BD48D97